MNKIIIFFIAGFLGYLYNPNQDMDLYRYYQYADDIDSGISILEFIKATYLVNFDFIYFSFFLLFKKLDIPKELVTALFLGLFYSQTLLFLELVEKKFFNIENKKCINLVKLFSILSVTPIIIFSISRNLAGIAILLIGVNLFLKNKKIYFLLFLLSIFTHLVMMVYIAGLILFYNFKSIHINKRLYRNIFLIVATVVGLMSKIWIDELLNIIKKVKFFDVYSRYAIYVDQSESNLESIFNALVFYDILPILLFSLILLIGLISIKKYNNITWVCYYFYIILTVFIGYSATFTQRTIILLLPLQGLIALSVFNEKNKNKKFIFLYKLIITSSIIMILLNIYAYRFYLFS